MLGKVYGKEWKSNVEMSKILYVSNYVLYIVLNTAFLKLKIVL